MSQAVLDDAMVEKRVFARPDRMLRGAILIAIPSLLMLAHRFVEFRLEHPLWVGHLWKVPVSVGDAILKLAFPACVIAATTFFRGESRRPAPMRIAIAFAAITAGGFCWFIFGYWRGMGTENWFYVDIAFDVAVNFCLALLAVCSWEVSRKFTRGKIAMTLATAVCIVAFFAAIGFMLWWDGLQIYANYARAQEGALPKIVRWFDQNAEFDAPFHLVRLAAQTGFWLLIMMAALPRRANDSQN
jgi:hypothetical protein